MANKLLMITLTAVVVVTVAAAFALTVPKDAPRTPSEARVVAPHDLPGGGWEGVVHRADPALIDLFLPNGNDDVEDACYTFIARGGQERNQTLWVFLAHMSSNASAEANFPNGLVSTESMYLFDLGNLSWARQCRAIGYTYNSTIPGYGLDEHKTVFTLVKGEYYAFMIASWKDGGNVTYSDVFELARAQTDKIGS